MRPRPPRWPTAAARATGKVGVLCVVPGPGLTNTLTNLGEALLDSVPVVCIAGDVANGHHFRPFQVHCLDNATLLRPVTKQVFVVQRADAIPHAVRMAFQLRVRRRTGTGRRRHPVQPAAPARR